MDSLLDALQEGRLIELPDNDKNKSLQFLSHIIEAIPSVPSNTDVAGLILKREESYNTSLGRGFACPHVRFPFDGDLLCAVGWSPTGITYGAADKNPVHIVIMYLVPDNQKNSYLKEVSNIVKALVDLHDETSLKTAPDLNTVRSYLLDLISSAKSIVIPETRARMIQLETREAVPGISIEGLANLIIEPVTIISIGTNRHITLSQNKELSEILDNSVNIVEAVSNNGFLENSGGWRIIKRSSSLYHGGRVMYDCLAVKVR